MRIATGTLRPRPVTSRMNSGCLAIEICSGFCGASHFWDFQSSTSWLWLYQSYIYSNVSIYEYALTSNFTCMFIYPTYLHIVIVSYFFILRCLMAQWHYTYITYSTISYGDFRVHFFVELHILRFAKALYVINPQAFGWQHGHCHHPTAYPKPWLS